MDAALVVGLALQLLHLGLLEAVRGFRLDLRPGHWGPVDGREDLGVLGSLSARLGGARGQDKNADHEGRGGSESRLAPRRTAGSFESFHRLHSF